MNITWKNFFAIRNIHTSSFCHDKIKSLKGKKHSSQLWLIRQMRDPYVEKAKQENYRCRSAFKLLEINEKYNIIKPGDVIIDCGAAPGSWSQAAVKLSNADGSKDGKNGSVYSIDKQPIHPIPGAVILGNHDFTTESTQQNLRTKLNDTKVDVFLSDMAPNATGMRDLDHTNIITLAYSALKYALEMTRKDGTLLVKLWDGGQLNTFKDNVSRFYHTVQIVRPQATRSESSELFILAKRFRGLK